jgi:hypothetical protein
MLLASVVSTRCLVEERARVRTGSPARAFGIGRALNVPRQWCSPESYLGTPPSRTAMTGHVCLQNPLDGNHTVDPYRWGKTLEQAFTRAT